MNDLFSSPEVFFDKTKWLFALILSVILNAYLGLVSLVCLVIVFHELLDDSPFLYPAWACRDQLPPLWSFFGG